ncbi:zinc-dependent alcohol dehydrogenase family protein [Isoalcanivorax indicus]|uniref:zinc-dependent alcohol dehydrogenase family protein n=1 Tax=Isoalcanivorax indicus TaxID=2202653 RepID=UPI000DBA7D3C|nr:NAD(P)-dependent alcohol dehydrogenase [Isoalcanivorax indicus]
MRAIQLERFGPDGLVPVDKAVGEPGPGQVRVRMHAASLNYHDLATVMGMANPKMPLPQVPLSDGAGVVEALGDGVTTLAVGDRVTTSFFPGWVAGGPSLAVLRGVTGETLPGALQEQMVAPASAFVPCPAHLTDIEAATLPCAALTAWRAVVVEGRIKAGDRVLIQGTGGVSLFALQFARLLGAETVVISSSDEKLELARGLGADHLINYQREPRWGRAVREACAGEGVDLVVEIGGAGTLPESLNAVRIGAHISMIGVLAGVAANVPTAKIMAMNVTVRGITVGNREQFEAMNRAISLHQLRPVVGDVFGFDGLPQALQTMQAAGHTGKLCLDYGR